MTLFEADDDLLLGVAGLLRLDGHLVDARGWGEGWVLENTGLVRYVHQVSVHRPRSFGGHRQRDILSLRAAANVKLRKISKVKTDKLVIIGN